MPKRKAAAAAGSSSADVSESAKKATRASERLAKKAKVKAEGAIVQTPSPFTRLPLEILQNIVLHLEPFAYLTFKFVCKDFNKATKTSEGAELVSHELLSRPIRSYRHGPDASRRAFDDKQQFGRTMATIEAGLSTEKKRDKLTCSICGYLNDHSSRGFPDEQFQQKDAGRSCIECLADWSIVDFIHVHQQLHFVCCSCFSVHPARMGFDQTSIEDNFEGMILQYLRLQPPVLYQYDDAMICGRCLNTAIRDASHMLVADHQREEPMVDLLRNRIIQMGIMEHFEEF